VTFSIENEAAGPPGPDRVILRPATRADIDAIIDEPLRYRVRAWAAGRGGQLLAVGGFIFQPFDTVLAFLILAAPASSFALSLHKAGKHMMNEARRLRLRRVVATAEQGNPAAEPWLARFGFEPVMIGTEKVWVWRNET
jgi:hypothetical protein